MEDKPIFKFKKTNAKLVGGINALSTDLYDYLETNGWVKEVKFLHVKKMWNVEETQDELDQNMNVVKPGIKRKPEFHVIRGFLKDGKLVAEKTQVLVGTSIMGIEEKYAGFLRECMSQGWKKDEAMYSYFNKTGSNPTYHIASNNSSNTAGFDLRDFSGDAKLHMPPTKTQQQIEIEAAQRAAENALLTQSGVQTPKSNKNIFQRILKTIKIG